MSAPRIALVVGNGFSIGFNTSTGLDREWNTQAPLGWDIKAPGSDLRLLNVLPRLRTLRDAFPDLNDFDFFIKGKDPAICRRLGLNPVEVVVEARHYLTLAFSQYSLMQRRVFSSSWNWFRWIAAHRADICAAVSLNYDLLLETCFDRCGKLHYSWQENHHGTGVPLVKPHGSINMEIADWAIHIDGPITYPLKFFANLVDGPVNAMPQEEWLSGRKAPLCILPNESNEYRNFQFVAPAYEAFFNAARTCTHCVFVGLSYFPCDRPELNQIIDVLPRHAQIVIANPYPPKDFLSRLEGRPVMEWTSFDGPISNHGDLLLLKNTETGKVLPKCFCGSRLSYRDCCGLKVKAAAAQ
jgi:hypothetical protein